jgi:hypothetical protein
MAKPIRKRGNPDFKSTCIYLTKRTDLEWRRAFLDLEAQGHHVERSALVEQLLREWLKNPRPIDEPPTPA